MRPVFAGWFALNGNGEMTGTTWVEESGFLEGPVMITNTHSVGVVRDAVIAWRLEPRGPTASGYSWSLPVVAETWDGALNDINGFHVKREHVVRRPRRRGRRSGGRGQRRRRHRHDLLRVQGRHRHRVAASSRPSTAATPSACWCRPTSACATSCAIAGVPVGRETDASSRSTPTPSRRRRRGSIIVVVATDAPLLPHQLKRLARRAPPGPRPHRQHRRATARATSSSPSRPPTTPWRAQRPAA